MKTITPILLLAALALIACGKIEVNFLASTPTPTRVAALSVNTATTAIDIPTPTLVLPVATQVERPTPTAVPTMIGEAEIAKIFLIALEDNGRSGPLVGCGDSVVAVNVNVPRTPGVLEAAMGKLLSEKTQYYGESGLYNALYQSNLQVSEIKSDSGKTVVRLTGTMRLGGTCDAPRLKAQIEQTALQFSPGNSIAVFVNDVPLDEMLSQK